MDDVIAAKIIQIIARIFFRLYFRLSIKGGKNIPDRGGVILAANHTSYLDPLVLGASSKRLTIFMMLESYYENPLFHWFCRIFRSIPVKREGRDLSGIRKALTALKENKVLGIFPEGSRSEDGVLLEPRAGVSLLAYKSNVPVIPVAITGAHDALPKRGKIPKPRKISIRFGEPLYPDKFFGRKDEFASAIMNRIAELIDASSLPGRAGDEQG